MVNGTGEEFVDAELPASLRERLVELVEAYRGYEPASTAAAVAVLCEAAERELDLEVGGSLAVTGPDTAAPDGPASPGEADDPLGATDVPGLLDEAFPYDWDDNPSVETYLPQVLEAYLETAPDSGDPTDRADHALAAVADDADIDPELLEESLVTGLYGGAGLSTDVATEFFVDSLADAESVAARESGPGDAAAADGYLAVPRTSGADGVATPERPRSDCERCGATTPVDDLETVIGPQDGSTVELLCADCVPADE